MKIKTGVKFRVYSLGSIKHGIWWAFESRSQKSVRVVGRGIGISTFKQLDLPLNWNWYSKRVMLKNLTGLFCLFLKPNKTIIYLLNLTWNIWWNN